MLSVLTAPTIRTLVVHQDLIFHQSQSQYRLALVDQTANCRVPWPLRQEAVGLQQGQRLRTKGTEETSALPVFKICSSKQARQMALSAQVKARASVAEVVVPTISARRLRILDHLHLLGLDRIHFLPPEQICSLGDPVGHLLRNTAKTTGATAEMAEGKGHTIICGKVSGDPRGTAAMARIAETSHQSLPCRRGKRSGHHAEKT